LINAVTVVELHVNHESVSQLPLHNFNLPPPLCPKLAPVIVICPPCEPRAGGACGYPAAGDRIHQKLVQVAETVRRMSHELHPAVLQYSGLSAAVQSYCQEFGVLTGVKVSLTTEGAFDGVAPGAALCIYRVTQEALRNVARHAKVDAAAVDLRQSGAELILAVSDAGVGMPAGPAPASAGLGVVSMKERARLAGGTIAIRSEPTRGTTVTLRIPG